MLEQLLVVTTTAEDLSAVEDAYTRHLHYRVIDRAAVSPSLARAWAAPAMAGRASLLLEPMTGKAVHLRFVKSPRVPGYAPLTTWGWNSTEILVEDPDALAEALHGSPFRIIGAPAALSANAAVRAMQVVGPADEVLYLTRIPPGQSAFGLGSAEAAVDRVFIVVAGGPDVEALRGFYRDVLEMEVTPAMPATVEVLSDAHGLPRTQQHPMAVAPLPRDFLVELDGYPDTSGPRPARAGELPPGMASVAFRASGLPVGNAASRDPGVVVDDPPYAGARVTLLRGVTGERIELVTG